MVDQGRPVMRLTIEILRKNQKKAIIIPLSTGDNSRRVVLPIGGGIMGKEVHDIFQGVPHGPFHEGFFTGTVYHGVPQRVGGWA